MVPEGPRPGRATGPRREQGAAMNDHAYSDEQRAAVYRVIEERRDVRRGFLPDPIPADVLTRVIAAAHRAPSVGLSQPWDFILLADRPRRERIKQLADRARADYAASLPGARALAFDRLKTEGILDPPVNIVVTCDPTRGGRHTLGRHSQPQTAAYSSVLAVANLWLAARAEGLGVGWVSFFGERELAAELGLPPHLEVGAYLCLGHVTEVTPEPEPAAVAVFAGDHGVHAQGVTPWPQEVTAQMVANFLAGGAVVNAFAAQAGAEVTVVDVGVAAELEPVPGLLPRKIAPGTADFTEGPAMTRDQALAALTTGVEIARDLVAAGNRCLVTGDMGIANTTASAALICAFTGADPVEATGRGTGIDAATYARKIDVVCRGLARHRPDPEDPVGMLAAFGGFEHAALAGYILGAAALRVPVILDGVISGAAALAAAALAPDVTAACFAGHRSVEPGHAMALDRLGLTPLVDLGLRLGEGTGALLALPLIQSAARALRDVATFDSAGVTEKQ